MRRTKLGLLLALAVCLALALALGLGCHGHIVRRAPNHSGAPFDFEKPPHCDPKPFPESSDQVVDIRYLGAAGLYIRWGDDSILLDPFFSNPSLPRVLLGRWRTDCDAIASGLSGIPVSKVDAILVSHSHYDHIGDLPVILDEAADAQVFANLSGARVLAPYPAAARTTLLEGKAGQWVQLRRGNEERTIRFFPIFSSHAPQIGHYVWGEGNVPERWRVPWDFRRFRDLRAGEPFAFVIDLLSQDKPAKVRYRIYYQGSANHEGTGEPPPFSDGHPYDLAVLSVASHQKVRGCQPRSILKALRVGELRPRHVLATHYEDIFRKQGQPVRFVSLLTDDKVEKYLATICDELDCRGVSAGPTNRVCGPSGPRWTMPLPGDWMRFSPSP